MIKKISKNLHGFHYFVKGSNPKLLLHSGTHGDEYEIIDLIKDAVNRFENKLPDFVFVPYVSPSAVSAKTRVNAKKSDLNRIFFSDSDDLEVQENMNVIKNYNFDLMVTFHEDPELSEYYIYDEGKPTELDDLVKKHNQKLKVSDIGLLNGVDDIEDPILGQEFVEGYKKFIYKKEEPVDGLIPKWAYNNGYIQRSLVPETPGKLSLDNKKFVIESFFKEVLTKYQAI